MKCQNSQRGRSEGKLQVWLSERSAVPSRSPTSGKTIRTITIVVVVAALAWWSIRFVRRSFDSLRDSEGRAPSMEESPELTIDPEGGQSLPDGTRWSLSHVITERSRRQAEALSALLDPARDGWDTERFNTLAQEQLDVLSSILDSYAAGSAKVDIGDLIETRFRCERLRPKHVTVAVPDAFTKVIRSERSDWRTGRNMEDRAADLDLLGESGLRTAISSMIHPKSDAKLHFSLKIDRVFARDNGEFETAVMLETMGRHSDHGQENSTPSKQIVARWRCTWVPRENARPLLREIQVREYEEVNLAINSSIEMPSASEAWFVDATEHTIGRTDGYQKELRLGMDDWVNRLERRLMISRLGHHGLAIGDVNGDGRDDVYICQPGGLPNRLMVQTETGLVEDRSHASRSDYFDATVSALLVDLDNDGDQDLVLGTVQALVILSNDGNGQFTRRTTIAEGDRTYSLVAADYDQDGLVDLYACRYHRDSEFAFEFPLPVPYHDANNGGKNFLFQNLGEFQFRDVTERSGLNADNTRFSFAAAWEDFDNDGDQDLYVANDYGRNCLYRNNEGTFRNVAAALDVEDIASGMSVSWADFNHNGFMDLYVSNMYSKAGNRITRQVQFSAGRDDDVVSQLQRHARGNTLFSAALRMDSDPRQEGTSIEFQDVSVELGASMGRWAWGSLFADINNDGWDDLLIVNGLMTTEDTGDL